MCCAGPFLNYFYGLSDSCNITASVACSPVTVFPTFSSAKAGGGTTSEIVKVTPTKAVGGVTPTKTVTPSGAIGGDSSLLVYSTLYWKCQNVCLAVLK